MKKNVFSWYWKAYTIGGEGEIQKMQLGLG